MFDLLFSPDGRVGRGIWWASQMVCIIVLLVLVALALNLATPYLQQAQLGHALHYPANWHQFSEDLPALERMGSDHPGPTFVLLLLFATTYWVSAVIEIKRWHDREMSGWWFLLRVVVAFLPNTGPGFFFLLVVTLFQLINLGFIGPGYIAVPRDRRDPRDNRAAAENILGPIRLVFRTIFVIGLGAIFLGITLPFWMRLLKIPHKTTTAYQSPAIGSAAQTAPALGSPGQTPVVAPGATSSSPPPVADAASKPLDESAYHGTSATTYDRTWVMVNGAKVDGIMAANPAPHAQVAILNADGGMNVPAASLPQGFLNDWNLTPQRLKAADQP